MLARVNGGPWVPFLVDTGASINIVDEQVAAAAGLTPGTGARKMFGGGEAGCDVRSAGPMTLEVDGVVCVFSVRAEPPSKKRKTMKKALTSSREPDEGELRPEYHFDYEKAKPNRFVGEGQKKGMPVIIDEDVAEIFTTPESVNKGVFVYSCGKGSHRESSVTLSSVRFKGSLRRPSAALEPARAPGVVEMERAMGRKRAPKKKAWGRLEP